MVDASALKFYKSKNAGLGGDIDTSLQIISDTPNNLFSNVSRTDQVAGATFYECMYLKNTSTERMGDLSLWISHGTSNDFTFAKWARESTAGEHPYKYAPWMDFNGSSDFVEVADSADLDLGDFTISCWFNTETNFATEGYIVVKGKKDTASFYLNYGIWMDAAQKIVAGFEDSAGVDKFITSAASYDDGKWHSVLLTYSQSLTTLELYIDNVSVGTVTTSAVPMTNASKLAIGRKSDTSSNYFQGKIDEVRVWNRRLTSTERIDLYNGDDVPDPDTMVYENKFGKDNGTRIAQEVADVYTEPTGVTWQGTSNEPDKSNFLTLEPGAYKPIWVEWVVDAGAQDDRNDELTFSFAFTITSTGTGTPSVPGEGGNTGGNPEPTPTDYKIAIVGDWGEENETDDVVKQIKDGGYNLVLGLGDNSYTSSDSAWWKIVKDIDDNQGSSIQFESCMGNHDSASDLKSHLHYPNMYTSFDFQNIHVLIMNTEENMDVGSSQYNFVKADLEAQDTRSNIDWIFVLFHRPAVGAVDHPIDEENQVENYFDLFKQHNVTLVCSGHNHNWQRTFPINRSGSGAKKVISDSDGPYIRGQPQNWFINVISGAGGHDSDGSLYKLGSNPSYNAYSSRTENGVFSVEASSGGQTLTCRFINTSGDAFDTFTMTQN